MAKINFGVSPTSVILRVKLLNSSVTTGAGLTGLAHNSAGLIIGTMKIGDATTTAYTQAADKIETIATLGTYAAPTATKCRLKEVDAVNHPGLYEIQLANARFASTDNIIISIHGVANLAQCDVEVQCTNLDSNLAQILGTALTETGGYIAAGFKKLFNIETPVLTMESVNQSANNNTILAHADYGNAKLVRSTAPANKLDVSATGEAGLDFANIKDATGAHTLTNITVPICTFNTDMRGTDNAANASVWNVDRSDDLVAIKAITDQITFDGDGNVNTSISRPTGAVIADGGNSSSSFVTDLTESVDDYWLGGWVKFTSGNLVNQVKKIASYNGTTRVLTFTSAYTETPAGGDTFEFIVE